MKFAWKYDYPRLCVLVFHWNSLSVTHDDVIKWKHFPHYWPFVRGIHRSPVNSPRKGQWRGALMFSFTCTWINNWVNSHEAGDLGRDRAHYDVTVMCEFTVPFQWHTNKLFTRTKRRLQTVSTELQITILQLGYGNIWHDTHLGKSETY